MADHRRALEALRDSVPRPAAGDCGTRDLAPIVRVLVEVLEAMDALDARATAGDFVDGIAARARAKLAAMIRDNGKLRPRHGGGFSRSGPQGANQMTDATAHVTPAGGFSSCPNASTFAVCPAAMALANALASAKRAPSGPFRLTVTV